VEATNSQPEWFPYAIGALEFLISYISAFATHRLEHKAESWRDSNGVATVSGLLASLSFIVCLEFWPDTPLNLVFCAPWFGAILLGHSGRPLINKVLGLAGRTIQERFGLDSKKEKIDEEKK
jgi:hypothetical protein